jgi:hypothetical protein
MKLLVNVLNSQKVFVSYSHSSYIIFLSRYSLGWVGSISWGEWSNGELLASGTGASRPCEVAICVGKSEAVWSIEVHDGALGAGAEVGNVVVIFLPWSHDGFVA